MQSNKFNFNFIYLGKSENEYINSSLNSAYASIKKEDKTIKYTMKDLNNIFLQYPYNYTNPPEKIFNETIKHLIITEETEKLIHIIKNAYFIDELRNEKLEKDTLHIILQKNPKILIEIYDNKLYYPEYFPIYKQFINEKSGILALDEFKIMIEFIIELFNYNYVDWYQSSFKYNYRIQKECRILIVTRLLKKENETYLEFLLNNLNVFIDTTKCVFGGKNEIKYKFGITYGLGDRLKFNIHELSSLINLLKDELENILISHFVPQPNEEYKNIDDISYKLLKALFIKSAQKDSFQESAESKNPKDESLIKHSYKSTFEETETFINPPEYTTDTSNIILNTLTKGPSLLCTFSKEHFRRGLCKDSTKKTIQENKEQEFSKNIIFEKYLYNTIGEINRLFSKGLFKKESAEIAQNKYLLFITIETLLILIILLSFIIYYSTFLKSAQK